MKKTILCFIIAIYALTSVFAVFAAPSSEKSEKSISDEKEEKVKKESGTDKHYDPHADYMLLCDVESGFRIYSKGSKKIINPYGFTKILTAITVIENQKDINKEVIIPKNILKDYDYSYGNISLASGEKTSIKNLL